MRKLLTLTICVTLLATLLPQTDASANSQTAVYRFYNKHSGVHFFTASENEQTQVKNNLSSIYRNEGTAFHAYASGGAGYQPVHRFYSIKNGVHFYTANQQEATNVNNTMGSTYRYEGIAYYIKVSSTGLHRVHRFYNFKQGVHFYTINQSEASNINNRLYRTYRYEGVSYYATPARSFKNCTEAHAAGVTPIYKGQPGYSLNLDRDRDNIACELAE